MPSASRMLAFVFVVATASCHEGDESFENHGALAEPVVFGAPSGALDDGVVLLQIEHEGYCTGVLIDDRTVLTARHCVSELGPGTFACGPDGHLTLYEGTSGTFVGDRRAQDVRVFVGSEYPAPHALPIARGRRIVTDGARTICGHDLAAVLLDNPLGTAQRVRISASDVRVGESVRLVGWGLDETGSTPSSRRSRAGLAVSRSGPAPERAPHGSALTAGEFEIGEGACDGDSGGAILDAAGDLVGIVSRGDGDRREARGPSCFGADAANVISRVDGHLDLIKVALAPEAADGASLSSCTHVPRSFGSRADWTTSAAMALLLLGLRRRRRRAV